MRRLNESFGLIRVINLRERKDRLREVMAQMAALGTGFEPGRVELYEAERPTDLGRFIRWACAAAPRVTSKSCYRAAHPEVLTRMAQPVVAGQRSSKRDTTSQ